MICQETPVESVAVQIENISKNGFTEKIYKSIISQSRTGLWTDKSIA